MWTFINKDFIPVVLERRDRRRVRRDKNIGGLISTIVGFEDGWGGKKPKNADSRMCQLQGNRPHLEVPERMRPCWYRS